MQTRECSPCRWRAARRDERGQVTVFVVLVIVALFAMAGLVIDGGSALAEKRSAMNTAEQAARVGADALDPASLRSGDPTVLPARAAAATQAYLSQAGVRGTVNINGGEVTVTVRDTYDTVLLSAVGVGSMRISSTAAARSVNADDN